MLRVAQECFSGRLACEHARLSFDAKLELEARDTGNEADDGLRKVDVEIVADNVPLCGGSGAAEQVAEKPREILFRPGIALREDQVWTFSAGYHRRHRGPDTELARLIATVPQSLRRILPT